MPPDTRPAPAGGRAPRRLPLAMPALALSLALAPCAAAAADGLQVSGRIAYGAVMRLEAPDPMLLTGANAAVIGLAGRGNGANADDGNLNYARHDWVSRALLANLDLRYEAGPGPGAGMVALVRIAAWDDEGLRRDPRPWGNAINAYAPGRPLGDAGTDRLSRFSGAALGEAWIEHTLGLGATTLLARVGRQTTPWGEHGAALEAMGPRDIPAARRAGSLAQETRMAAPMLFLRLAPEDRDGKPVLALESFVQAFRPSALDVCGSFWSTSDYQAEGCNWVMSGPPLGLDDRARVAGGAVMQRLPTVRPSAPNRGLALFWQAGPGLEIGAYRSRYGWRQPMPGIRRSTRAGPPLVAGNPDGRNMAFFTEYVGDLDLSALTLAWQAGAGSLNAELSWRQGIPFMLAPGDVLPPFLNASAPSLLRDEVDALAPGAVFHGYDRHTIAQLQLLAQWHREAAGLPMSAQAELQFKHTPGMPDQALRRYGRSDLFGAGPIAGNCIVSTGDPARQCSLRGYQTADAWAYRLRVDARLPDPAPGLAAKLGVSFMHEVKGWSGDYVFNQGRRHLLLACQLEYHKRYFAELTLLTIWGGDYNPIADRDALALAAGVRF